MAQAQNVAGQQTGLNEESQYVRGIVINIRRGCEGVEKFISADADVGPNILEMRCSPSAFNGSVGQSYYESRAILQPQFIMF